MAVELGSMLHHFAEVAQYRDDRSEIDAVLNRAGDFVEDQNGQLVVNEQGKRRVNEFKTDHLHTLLDVLETYVAFAKWDENDLVERWNDGVEGNDLLTAEDIDSINVTPAQREMLQALYDGTRDRLGELVTRDMDKKNLLKGGRNPAEVLIEMYDNNQTPFENETDEDRAERLLLTYALRNSEPNKVWEWNKKTGWLAVAALALSLASVGGTAYKVNEVATNFPQAFDPAPAAIQSNVESQFLAQAPTANPDSVSVVTFNQAVLEGPGFSVEAPTGKMLRISVSETFTQTGDIDNPDIRVLQGTVNGDPLAPAIIVQNAKEGITEGFFSDPRSGKMYSLSTPEGQPENVVTISEIIPDSSNQPDAEVPDAQPVPHIQTQDTRVVVATPLGFDSAHVIDIGFMATASLSDPTALARLDVKTTLATQIIQRGLAGANGTVRKVCMVPAAPTFTAEPGNGVSMSEVKRKAFSNPQVDDVRRRICRADLLFIVAPDVQGMTANSYFKAKGFEANGAMAPFGGGVIPEGALDWSTLHEWEHVALGADHQAEFATVPDSQMVDPAARGGVYGGKYTDAMTYPQGDQQRVQTLSSPNNPTIVNGVAIGDAGHDQVSVFNRFVADVSGWVEPALPFSVNPEPAQRRLYIPIVVKR